MSTQLRLLAALGAGVGAALIFAPIAAADGGAGVLPDGDTLQFGGDPTDIGYLGWRPFATDWWGLQPVNLVNQDGDTLGTYQVGEADFQSPILDTSVYYYHTAADLSSGSQGSGSDDPAGLNGTFLYDVGFGPGLGGADAGEDATGQPVLFDSLTAFGPDGAYYWVITGPDGFQNTMEVSPTHLTGDLSGISFLDTSDYVTLPGQDQPMMLWDTLGHTDLGPTDVADMLPPDQLIDWP